MKIGMLTSGGDCPGLNAVMRAFAKYVCSHIEDVKIFGFLNGYTGLIENEYEILAEKDFEPLLLAGGTVLGSKRQPFIWNYYQYEQHSYLRNLDATGAELSCTELSSSSNGDDSFYPYNMVVTDDGKVVVTSDMLIRVFNTDGSVDFDIDLDNYPENLIKLRDGNVGILA